MNRLLKLFFIGYLLILSACGGGGGSGGGNGGNPSVTTTKAVLLDGVVQGVRYDAGSGVTGVTDSNGVFDYVEGQPVSFYLGNILLGTASPVNKPAGLTGILADKIVTPLELVGVKGNLDDPQVLNRARLLLTLDADGNPNNGIQIASSVVDALQNTTSLSFGETFNPAAVLQAASNASGQRMMLVDSSTAKQHLCDSLGRDCSDGGSSNHAPTIGGTPATSVNVDESYSFTPAARDVDTGDSLTFSITNKPTWATFSAITGVLSGTPDSASVSERVIISVTDGKSTAVALPAFTLTVIQPNRAPSIGGTPTTSINVDASYSFTPTASDADTGDTLTFSIANKPTWANFNTATGELSGTPSAAGVSAGIVISVTDGKSAGIALRAFTLTVIQLNRAPTIDGTPATSVNVGEAYSFTPTVSDADTGETLTFSITNQPTWATFSPTTGTLSGTPSAAGISTGIVISVTDGKSAAVALSAFTLTVVQYNGGLAISGTPAPSANVGELYSFTPTVIGVATGKTPTFSITNKPSWATFSETTGTLSGTPASGDVGTTNNIAITVNDGISAPVALPTFSIAVVASVNLARQYGVASQSTTYSGYPASNAIDGNATNFSHTNVSTGGDWWQVKLPAKASIASIVIKNRNSSGFYERLAGATIYVSNQPATVGISNADKVGEPLQGIATNTITLNPQRQGMYVLVRAGSAYLHMAEVEVIGFPSVAPAFEQSAYTFDLSYKAAQGAAVGVAKAGDFQGDALNYSIDGNVPFAINAQGNITLTGALRAQVYTFNVTVSDGTNTSSVPVTVNAPINLAREFGVATQGKDYDDASKASLTIDGNIATFNHTTCDATNNWWQVKLPNVTAVDRVVIGNRSGQAARLVAAKVYLSSAPYSGTLNDADAIGNPLTNATTQSIPLSPAKSGTYLIVKAATNQCLHMTEVEVYGQASATPVFDLSAYRFQVSNRVAAGQLVGKVKAIDYQLGDVAYTLTSGVPFAINAQGNITVSGALQTGTTYNFSVTSSDGVNSVSAPVTVVVTSSSSVEDALRTGDASVATTEELLDAAITELASKKTTPSLLAAMYSAGSIAYTPGNRTQLIDFKSWKDSVFPIVVGNKGNTLAVAGTTPTTRYAAFGMSPTELFQSNTSLSFETPFNRLLAWLLAGEPVDTNALSGSRKIALSFASSDQGNIKAWIASKHPSWTVTDCNTVVTLATCYGSADLVITGWQGNNADAQAIRQALVTVMDAGKPVLYLHTWYEDYNDVAHAIADLLKFSLPYGGNYWANDAANWANVTAMQDAMWEKQGLGGVEKLLNHFKAGDYTQTGLDAEFYPGANKVRAVMTLLDEGKVNLFQTNESRLYRLLALLGDSYRQGVNFPMDKDGTDANVFLKSLYADHAVYNYRTLNPVQPYMGNFSRSDFSRITPVTKTVTMTSRQNFRATGVYALPGKTFRVTRSDNNSTTTKVFINSVRSGSTHEFEAWGYKRPKYLQSAHVQLKSGETIALTSPYGGPIQMDFGTNDQSVSFTFEQVGEHPFWDDTSDNAMFSAKLAAGEYDWAEFVTPAFEIHSTLEKMRESASDARWGGTLEGFAAATMRYIHDFPHVLAGFKGPGIDVVPEIHNFATANGFAIDNLDLVKHMNADQATCGSGCSGNPYDAYWAFDPIGHGDIHELGHGLESGRFRLAGWNYHASTNPYSYYSKTQYFKTTGGDPNCQSLPFHDAFIALQASVGQADPVTYLKTNYWDAVTDNWSRAASMTIQIMMTAEHQGALQDGWHLLARLHILEREFNRARSDTTTWDAKKTSLGFSSYSKVEADAINNNDWMVIAVSKVTGLDYRSYFSMWGQAYSAKASGQVTDFHHATAERRFFITSPNGYCKGEGFDGNNLPVDGLRVWPSSVP